MFDDSENNPFLRRAGDKNLLTVVVHTASFEEAILAHDPTAGRLIRLAEQPRYRVVWTPTDNEEVKRALRRAYGAEIGEYQAGDDWLLIKTPLPVPVRHRTAYVGNWHRPAREGSRVTVLDELFTHQPAVDLFVVADGDPFLENDPRRRYYVSPEDALNLVRVLAATLEQDDSYYYQYRTAKLFPTADLARVAMNIARDHKFPAELRDQIESFRLRIQLILRAADRVAYHALRVPDGRAPGKCGYHLGYFIMLVTGLFDELAWTIALRYGIRLNRREVALRQKTAGAFFQQIGTFNADLLKFLSDPDTQARLQLFYPARNQFQHRTLLPTFLADAPVPRRVLAELPPETIREILALSANGGADWGMVNGPSGRRLVEPYLFTLAAVDSVAGVTNGILERLDWQGYTDLLPADVREEKREYFNTAVGTAAFTRHQDFLPPPYF